VRISGVDRTGPAFEGGLQVDDVVTAADGTPVRETFDLQREVAGTAPGTTMQLTVMRNKQERTISVTLGTMPAELAGIPSERAPVVEEEGADWPLGIAVLPISDLTAEIGQSLGIECQQGSITGLDRDKGIVVRDFEPGSVAAGRVIPGDVIDKVNGTAVTTVDQYREQMTAAMDGDQDFVVLHLMRVVDGETMNRVVDIELQ